MVHQISAIKVIRFSYFLGTTVVSKIFLRSFSINETKFYTNELFTSENIQILTVIKAAIDSATINRFACLF